MIRVLAKAGVAMLAGLFLQCFAWLIGVQLTGKVLVTCFMCCLLGMAYSSICDLIDESVARQSEK